MSAKRKAKFRVGQVVYSENEQGFHKIDARLFDPSDGWEYHFEGERPIIFNFEENLRAQTRREKGD